MGLKMLDMLSLGPVVLAGFGYWLMQKHEGRQAERLAQAIIPVSTGDKELDTILGISVSLPVAVAAIKPASS